MKQKILSIAVMAFLFSFATFLEANAGCPEGYIKVSKAAYSGGGYNCLKYVYSVAKFHKKVGCAKGTFKDPRKGGECWSCPEGYKRSIQSVTSAKACAKSIGILKYIYKVAKYHKKHGCLKGTFFDLFDGGSCWSCPLSMNRTAEHIKSPKACSKTLRAPATK